MPGPSDLFMDEVSPYIIRAQLAGASGDVPELERQVLERQLDAQVSGVGAVPEMKVGYWDDPKSYAQLATSAIGGGAALLGAGAKGIAQYGARQAAIEGLRDPAELLFQEAARRIPSMGARVAGVLLGVAGAGGTVAANAADVSHPSGLTQEEIISDYQRRGDEYARAQEAKRLAPPKLPPGMTFSDITSDPFFNNPAAFRAKYGMLPEQAMDEIQKRNQSHPSGTFRRGF